MVKLYEALDHGRYVIHQYFTHTNLFSDMMTMQCLPVRSQCLIMLKTEKGWEAMILRMSKEGWLVKRKSGGLVVL